MQLRCVAGSSRQVRLHVHRLVRQREFQTCDADVDRSVCITYSTTPTQSPVDVKIASELPPLAITSVTAPFYATVTDSFGSIVRYLPTYLGGGGTEKKPQRPGAIRLPSGIEMSGPSGEEKLEGSRGERRFSALNPHVNVDFYLPSAGVSEYLGKSHDKNRTETQDGD